MTNIIGTVWRWEAIDDIFGSPYGTVAVISEEAAHSHMPILRCIEVNDAGIISEKTWTRVLFDGRGGQKAVRLTLLYDPATEYNM